VGANQALEAARALAQNPSLASVMRNARLPGDISLLLRILAGDEDVAKVSRGDPARLQDVVERYIKAVMLYPGAPPERVLGVSIGASRDEMRAHMRWLMIWLHPDRGADPWRSAYSVRVLDAWRTLSANPPPVAQTPTDRRSNSRPQTMPLKLNWVPTPVSRQAKRRRRAAIAAPALLVLLIAAITAFDNPVRQWAESALWARELSAAPVGARPGL
jgi:hypothetical protein